MILLREKISITANNTAATLCDPKSSTEIYKSTSRGPLKLSGL